MPEYDVNSNPRALTAVQDEEDTEQLQNQLDEAERKIAELNKTIGMFSSKGWQQVKNDLFGELNKAMTQLAGTKHNTIEEVMFIRGQIAAYNRLMSMGEEATRRKELLVAAVKAAKEELNN